jgi:SAM-dependent methyltransferase
MSPEMKSEPTYVLGHSPVELERLLAQARMFEPFTRQFLEAAGIAPGMRVLDVGTGAGDVAFLAASLMGGSGEVVAVDRSEAALALAEARARQMGLENIRFLRGDPTEMEFEQPFDAVIGRLVLLYYADPASALRKLRRAVRAGGLIAFQDFDMHGMRSYPPSPLYERCGEWLRQTFERCGVKTQMGLQLYAAFAAAGLPGPTCRLDATVGSGKGHIAYLVVSEVIRSLLPAMGKFGIATAEEVGIETLRDRLEEEVVDGGGVIVSPSLIGAWAKNV